MRVEISGVPSGLVPLEVTQPGNTQGAIHVQTLEVDVFDSTGYTGTNTTLIPMQDEHAGERAVEAYTDEQVLQVHGDVPMVVICGNGTDIGGCGVHIVREMEGITDG